MLAREKYDNNIALMKKVAFSFTKRKVFATIHFRFSDFYKVAVSEFFCSIVKMTFKNNNFSTATLIRIKSTSYSRSSFKTQMTFLQKMLRFFVSFLQLLKTFSNILNECYDNICVKTFLDGKRTIQL